MASRRSWGFACPEILMNRTGPSSRAAFQGLFEDGNSLVLAATFLIHQSLASQAQDREVDTGLAKWSFLREVPPFRGGAASIISIAPWGSRTSAHVTSGPSPA
jgi:hypothetical protein